MTVGEWLSGRSPRPPAALRARLEQALGDAWSAEDVDVTETCLAAAERLVSDLLRDNCTTRDSALELLAADALVTYAFEAAARSPADLVPRAAESMRRIAALGTDAPAGVTAAASAR